MPAVSHSCHSHPVAVCWLWCAYTHARYSKDKPRLGDTLEIIKFLCKDFWQAVFKKQVDNLKTNHRVGAASTSSSNHQQQALTVANSLSGCTLGALPSAAAAPVPARGGSTRGAPSTNLPAC